MTRRAQRRERGAMAPAMGIAVVLMSMLAVGAVGMGRIAAVRSDGQRAADAAVLAAAQIIRERGLPFDGSARAAAETIARRNSQLPISFTWSFTETPTSVNFRVQTSIALNMPSLIWSGGTTTVEADAAGFIAQSRFDDAVRRLPKLVLALDYSGSMSWPFSGGSGRAIDVLEDSVAGLLAADLMIDYGGVFYSSSVFRTHGIGPAAPNQIITSMNTYDAGGSTATGAAISTARNVLTAADNTGYYILLVSDGEPTCCAGNPFAEARNAARVAWDSDVSIFTLEIRRSGSSAALDQFMTDVAGTPTSRGNRDYHFVATTAADLIRAFEDIVASIVCKVGPLVPAPVDPSTVSVFLANGVGERRIPATGDLAADRAIEAFQYDTGDQTLRLTEAACDAVIDAGDETIVRFDRPTITE